MKPLFNITLVAASLALVSCVFIVSADDAHWEDGDASSTVNRSIRLPANSQSGDLSSVNGRIEVGPDSQVAEISTVNGSIRIGARGQLVQIESVNGGVQLGEGVRVQRGIEVVNGRITLAPGVAVQDSVTLVNGGLRAEQAHIGGAVETVNGELELLAGSRVDQGLQVRASRGASANKPVRIVLGEGVVVAGISHFERPVRIFRHDSASLGEYHGVDVSIRPWDQRDQW